MSKHTVYILTEDQVESLTRGQYTQLEDGGNIIGLLLGDEESPRETTQKESEEIDVQGNREQVKPEYVGEKLTDIRIVDRVVELDSRGGDYYNISTCLCDGEYKATQVGHVVTWTAGLTSCSGVPKYKVSDLRQGVVTITKDGAFVRWDLETTQKEPEEKWIELRRVKAVSLDLADCTKTVYSHEGEGLYFYIEYGKHSANQVDRTVEWRNGNIVYNAYAPSHINGCRTVTNNCRTVDVREDGVYMLLDPDECL